jgi:uncharacterized YigZ family protein
MGFRTVAATATHRETIKGSVFWGCAERVSSKERAETRLAELRSEHPDASHVCFAYRVGAEQRFSDDGEPGGTAGRPILEVIQQRDLDHVLVAVIRWFGGTRLGAGGLVRAYSGTSAKTLDRAAEREVLDTVRFAVDVPFALMDATLRFLGDDARVLTKPPSFTAHGMRVVVTVTVDAAPEIRSGLTDLTRGEAEFIEER